MDMTTTETDGVTVVRVAGRIDSSTSAAFQDQMQAAVRTGPRVVLDLQKTAFVSSAGLRVVLMTAKATKAAAGRFALFGLVPAVHDVFKLSGFAQIVTILASEAEAIALVRG